MLFPTLDFALFFLGVAALMVPLADRFEARKLVLLVASYLFYANWNWRFCFLLAFSSLVSYVAGLLLDRSAGDERRRGRIVAAAVTIHLALLGTFKYFDFFVSSANDLARALGLPEMLPFVEIILPVGISFYTFHGISYVVDVRRGDVAVCRCLTDMLLYLSFFPQLVAGPIVRASAFLPQLYRPQAGAVDIPAALLLILGGLFKKVVIANTLATDLVDPVFFDPAAFGAADLLLAAYGYAVQIYCDFSAYTDIAIGCAALLGFHFPRNFDQPYRAASLQEFWRRWHISLSSWLRDYLYKPLGGSRGGPWRTARNLAITMLLGGIWHGAAWPFVAWGALHGLGLIVGRALAPLTGGWAGTRAGRILGTFVVFHVVCLSWILFRAGSFETVMIYLAGFARLDGGIAQTTPLALGLIVLGLALHFLPPDLPARLNRLVPARQGWAMAAAFGVCALAIDALGPDGVPPFIYFQF
ncbi:MBOAT family protein [Rhodovastum atsumiense]|uniref:Probable alginate O-acetylase AlgI n=1 Tax=Rhodovastum atsumiense TaxID=504468 RepID=A0A5M6IV44_9PROT|nr:MBOAT family O-acyltransferase [Rhodovastum atsumiense]KAA5612174.1 MBOAT family protein [Rhodovastum atsumiense]CAH2603873.1 MBOAT family protein [Rhodovastum atsumiense]